MADMNLLINQKCPHCKANLLLAVSGFCAELCTRTKQCSKCNKEFYIHVQTITTIAKQVTDADIKVMKDRLSWLKRQRRKTMTELLIQHETASRLYKEALGKASDMRNKHGIT